MDPIRSDIPQSRAPVSASGPVTAEQLLRMDKGRCELIRGEVIDLVPPGGEHGDVAAEIAFHIQSHVRVRNLGKVYAAETGFLLERDPDTVRAADVTFVRRDRVVRTPKYIPLAPDLAVEVLSPNDRDAEVSEKVRCWLDHGSRQVWVVDPRRRTVHIHSSDRPVLELSEQDAISGGDVLPGFSLSVKDCFPKE